MLITFAKFCAQEIFLLL
uniref:Uncharacterized protein n=1 Tax=Lepeophtheirus salmonis TaxID=72036 RepID=A0A0K2T4T9_LEPSM